MHTSGDGCNLGQDRLAGQKSLDGIEYGQLFKKLCLILSYEIVTFLQYIFLCCNSKTFYDKIG